MKAWIYKHYHWIIAGVILLLLAVCGGSDNNASGLHQIPVSEYLGISRTQYALAFSIRTCIAVVTTYLSGFLFRRLGYKKVVSCSVALYAAGYILLYTMTSSAAYYAGVICLGLGASFCGVAGAAYIVGAWFCKHRGTMLGLVTASTGIGGSLLCLLQTSLIDTYSWRSSYLLCAVLTLVLLILVLLTVRNDPKELGLAPYGQDAPAENKKKHKLPDMAFAGKSMPQLYRSVTFYLMILCTFLTCLGIYIVFWVIVPYLTDCGFSATQAGSLQSTMLLLLSGAKLLAGWLSDRIGPKWVQWGCVAFGVAGTVLLICADTIFIATVAVVLFAFSLPAITAMVALLPLPLFGYRAQTQYTGVFLSMIYVGSTVSSLLTNAIYDAMGSYKPAFYLALGLCGATLVLYPVLYHLTKREMKENTMECT